MRKFFLLILFFAMACSHNNGDRYLYAFSKNASLDLVQNEGSYMRWANIVAGDHLVFQYEFHAEDEEYIADDEYSEYIRFEIDPTLTKFEFTDEQLATIKLTFTQSCFCGFFDEQKDVPPVGTVSGEKVSENRWLIKMNVSFYKDENRIVENVFFLQE